MSPPFELDIPVRIVHGTADDAVPVQRSSWLMENVQAPNVQMVRLDYGNK